MWDPDPAWVLTNESVVLYETRIIMKQCIPSLSGWNHGCIARDRQVCLVLKRKPENTLVKTHTGLSPQSAVVSGSTQQCPQHYGQTGHIRPALKRFQAIKNPIFFVINLIFGKTLRYSQLLDSKIAWSFSMSDTPLGVLPNPNPYLDHWLFNKTTSQNCLSAIVNLATRNCFSIN